MNDLLKKYNDYMRLENCRAEYTLSNGENINVIYREDNFPHLLGLHKLKDIQLIQFWLDKRNISVKLKEVIRRIKNETFTDAIIDFNPKIIKSKIKSEYLLFEEKENKEFNHLGIAFNKNTGSRYIETFFHQPNDMYIAGQKIAKIKKFTLYSAENQIIVSDSF